MKKPIKLRTYIQIFFFLLIAAISVNHNLVETGKGISFLSTASLHALCPFGGVVTLYQTLTTGTFIQKIHESALVLMVIVILSAVLFGPVFCGWICPLGSLQEWFGKLGKRIFGKRYNRFIPASLDRKLRYLRYPVLAWVVYVTATTAVLVFSDYDPYFALFNFWTGEAAVGAILILGVTLVSSLFIQRPWCKYACPLGALLGISNLFRVFKIKRETATCINCGACTKACPMNIEVDRKSIVQDHQCISCLECTSEVTCPILETVDMKTGGGRYEN